MSKTTLVSTIKDLSRPEPRKITLPSGTVVTIYMHTHIKAKHKFHDQIKEMSKIPTVDIPPPDPQDGENK